MLSVIAENIAGDTMLFRLPQVSDCEINVSADSVDSVDKYGSLIKRVYRAKTAEVTLTNAHLDLNAYAAMAGVDKEIADETNTITAPKTVRVDSSETSVTLEDTPIEGSLQVAAIRKTGSLGDVCTLAEDSTATATTYAVDEAGTTITLPTLSDDDKADITEFLIKYEVEATAAVRVQQLSKKFPKTIKLTINALAYDPCETDTLQLVRIVFPSFQPSPECTISMATDATFDFTGEAQVEYCSTDKLLFYISIVKDDVEEDDE